MLTIVNQDNAHFHWNALASMHQLRRTVFSERLSWNVSVINGLEIDQFDLPSAHYLVHQNGAGRVTACTRLLPTLGPYLLADVFPGLVDGEPPRDPQIWESTRFCADHVSAPENIAALLMAGMLEFGLSRGLKAFVSVSDIRMEPIMRRSGWTPTRLGGVIDTGTDRAAAEYLPVTRNILKQVVLKAGVQGEIISNLREINPEKVAA